MRQNILDTRKNASYTTHNEKDFLINNLKDLS